MKQHISSEQFYSAVAAQALFLYNHNQKWKCDLWIEWINTLFDFDNPYGGIRGVPQAAREYATDEEIEALEHVFLKADGTPCL